MSGCLKCSKQRPFCTATKFASNKRFNRIKVFTHSCLLTRISNHVVSYVNISPITLSWFVYFVSRVTSGFRRNIVNQKRVTECFNRISFSIRTFWGLNLPIKAFCFHWKPTNGEQLNWVMFSRVSKLFGCMRSISSFAKVWMRSFRMKYSRVSWWDLPPS